MISLGDTVRCIYTGFTGVVVCISEWINGCIRVGIQSSVLKDHKPLEVEWIDSQQLEILSRGTKKEKAASGGPMPNCPRP